MNLEELARKHEKVAAKIKEIEMENAYKRKKREEYREEIVKLGFNPDKLDEQLEAASAKIKAKLEEIEKEINGLGDELGVS